MSVIAETRQAFETPQWYLESRGYNIRIRADIVREVTQGRAFRSMMDIGCGNGSMSIQLLNQERNLTLLDLSTSMLNIARSRVPEPLLSRVETINSGFLQAEVKPASQDLVICLGVVAYIEDLQPFVAKLDAVLKPGGLIIIECTDSAHWVSHLTTMYSKILGLFVPPKVPLCYHPSAALVAEFSKLGYRALRSWRYSLPPPVIRKPFSQDFHYRMIRSIFGVPAGNRFAWMGNECIFSFQKPPGKPDPDK